MVTTLLSDGFSTVWPRFGEELAKNGRRPDHDLIKIYPNLTGSAVGRLRADRGGRSALLQLAIIETAPSAEVVAQLTEPGLLGGSPLDLHAAIEMEEHLPALLSGLTP